MDWLGNNLDTMKLSGQSKGSCSMLNTYLRLQVWLAKDLMFVYVCEILWFWLSLGFGYYFIVQAWNKELIHVYDPYLHIQHNLPSLNLICVSIQCLLAYSISDF